MIIKTTRGSDFPGLHRYLTEDRHHEVVSIRELASVATAASEMAAVAGERPGVRKPVLHISISFAPEDAEKVTDALALELFDEIDAELGLGAHQCLIARHDDTPHKHYHRSTNIVHPLKFETPPDRPNQALLNPSFKRRASCKRPPRPLSWDAFMLPRLWAVCDRFAKEHGLRRVKRPLKSPASKDDDRPPKRPASAFRREERTGVKSLLEQHEAVRFALGAGTWQERQNALQALGIRLEAAEVAIKTGGSRIRGLRLVPIDDPKNAIKASSLGAGYGLATLDKSVLSGSPAFMDWWPHEKGSARTATASIGHPIHDIYAAYLGEFRRYEEQHAAARATAAETRLQLKYKHRMQRARLTSEIASERKAALAAVPRPFRTAARKSFQARFAAPRRAQLLLKQRGELRELRVPRKMGWATWLRVRGRAGDAAARGLLAEMEARHRRHGHNSKTADDPITDPLRPLDGDKGAESDRQEACGLAKRIILADALPSRPNEIEQPSASSDGEMETGIDPILLDAHLKWMRGKGGSEK